MTNRINLLLRVLMMCAAVLIAQRSSQAAPLTGLAHSNVTNATGPLSSVSVGRTWVQPTADTAVLGCVAGTPPASCVWGNAAFAWYKFGELAPTALVNVCKAAIEPGPFAPPDRPVVDPACADPCGCGNALDQKAVILKSAVKTAAVPISTSGVISLNWNAQTTCSDPTDGVAKPCADPAHPTWAVLGYRVLSGANGSPLTLLQSVGPGVTSLTLPNYGDGVYNFQVYAYNGQGDGARSGIVSIEVKKPVANDPKALPIAVEGTTLRVTFP